MISPYRIALIALSAVTHFTVATTPAFAQEEQTSNGGAEKKDEGESASPQQNSGESGTNQIEGTPALPQAFVENQKGCRVMIQGMPSALKNAPVSLISPSGGKATATVQSNKDGKTIATLSNSACKQNTKGWKAEIAKAQSEKPLQVGSLTFEPGSSGWHRAKRKDNYTVGLGGGVQRYFGTNSYFPMSRIELGYVFPEAHFIFSYELGLGSSSDQTLKISGNSAFDFLFFAGNSRFFRMGWGQESRASVFVPKRVVGGEVKDALLGTASSEISFIQLGIGDKWQWGGLGLSVDWLGVRAAVSRTDKVSLTELITTENPDGSVTIESKQINDDTSIALNESILRKNVGNGGTLRILYTTVSYSF